MQHVFAHDGKQSYQLITPKLSPRNTLFKEVQQHLSQWTNPVRFFSKNAKNAHNLSEPALTLKFDEFITEPI